MAYEPSDTYPVLSSGRSLTGGGSGAEGGCGLRGASPAALDIFLHTRYNHNVKAVLDTSFLISFSRIDRLELLREPDWELVAPRVVYHEAVEEGLKEGYPDAAEIARSFDRGHIEVLESRGAAGRSADEEVLRLAQEEGAILYSDDRGLLRRAARSGLRTVSSPDFLLVLHRGGRLTAEGYRSLLLRLRAEGRIDRPTMERYLKLGGEG